MFTTPCFIKKNTPELREKLHDLGYILHSEDELYPYLYTEYNEVNGTALFDVRQCIYCKTEELFIALAALRDDSDYM